MRMELRGERVGKQFNDLLRSEGRGEVKCPVPTPSYTIMITRFFRI
jgi:hypothetical protein